MIVSNPMLLLELLKSSHPVDEKQMGSNSTSDNQYDKCNGQDGTYMILCEMKS
jgi:hypothetical protein